MRPHLWIAVLFAAGAALLVSSFGHGRDQGIYAAVAQAIVDGGVPYRDAFDFKPPGIHLTYAAAAALFGAGERSIRLLEGMGLVVTACVMVDLATRWWRAPGVGAFAAALAVLTHVELDFWHTGQPESFGGMWTMVALRAAWRGPRSSHPELFACGLCFGLAALLKPTLGVGVIAIALWIAPERRKLLALFAGALVPVALCLAWLASAGALDEAYEIFAVLTPGYTALGHAETTWASLGAQTLARWPLCGGVAVGLALALVAHRSVRRRRAAGVIAAICLLGLVGVALQAKLFAYHYGALAPPAAMLAALGWQWAYRRAGRAFPLVALAAMASVVFWTATPHDLPDGFWARSARRARLFATPSERERHALATVAGVRAADNHRLASTLRRVTARDGRIFIWGFAPVIYGLAERRPASSYLYDVPQRLPWFSAVGRARLMAELEAAPPDAIVVEHGDVFPWVTGDDLDSAAALATFPRFRTFLASRYERSTTIAAFDLYLPK